LDRLDPEGVAPVRRDGYVNDGTQTAVDLAVSPAVEAFFQDVGSAAYVAGAPAYLDTSRAVGRRDDDDAGSTAGKSNDAGIGGGGVATVRIPALDRLDPEGVAPVRRDGYVNDGAQTAVDLAVSPAVEAFFQAVGSAAYVAGAPAYLDTSRAVGRRDDDDAGSTAGKSNDAGIGGGGVATVRIPALDRLDPEGVAPVRRDGYVNDGAQTAVDLAVSPAVEALFQDVGSAAYVAGAPAYLDTSRAVGRRDDDDAGSTAGKDHRSDVRRGRRCH